MAEDVVIFAHSMGNLALGAALHRRRCALGTSASWYEASGPLKGSIAADFAEEQCHRVDYAGPGSLANKLGYCDGEGHATAAAASCCENCPAMHENAKAIKKHQELYLGVMQQAHAHVRGAMCGDSPSGLASEYSVPLNTLATVVNFNEPNDGIVEISSCVNPLGYVHLNSGGGQLASGADLNLFERRYESPWYRAAVNHIDTTCRNGNGWWDSGRQPCRWYAARSRG